MSIRSRFSGEQGRRWRIGAVVAVAAIGLAWWWWPTFTGQAGGTDVVIVGDQFLTTSEREVTYRIHEDGFSIEWSPEIADWCDASAAVTRAIADHDPTHVVVSALADGTCGTPGPELRRAVADAADGTRLVVVVQPGDGAIAEDFAGTGAVVVEPQRLLGLPGELEQPCQWWDTCQPNGLVTVRDASGALTPEGTTRVARMIVPALR